MNADQIIDLLRIALQLTEKIGAIAKDDPAVWDRIKGDFNAAKEAFENATDR